MLIRAFIILLLALIVAPVQAEKIKIDGLTVLGTGKTLVDEQSDSTMVLRGLLSKYSEPIVGLTIQQYRKEVRFYMNRATWDKLKQKLIRARDQWATLAPKKFAAEGKVRGYRIANKRATLRLSIQGETTLDKRRLNFSLERDDNSLDRVFISLTEAQVKILVEQLYKVDEFLRYPGEVE